MVTSRKPRSDPPPPEAVSLPGRVGDLDQVWSLFRRLQQYVGWSDQDADRVRSAGECLRPTLPMVADDFFAAIESDPITREIAHRSQRNQQEMKDLMGRWLRLLFAGRFDRDYVANRWQTGLRHAEIGLDQAYTNMAMARLRNFLACQLVSCWRENAQTLADHARSLNLAIDLDLAILQAAYENEYVNRQQQAERSRAEQALRESEERYRGLIEGTHDLVQSVAPDGQIVFVNRAWRETLGYEDSEVTQLSLARVVHPDRAAHFRRAMARVLTGGVVLDLETTLITKAGRGIHVIGNMVGRQIADKVVAIQGIFHDVTQRRQAEERARHAERLAAIGQMITGLTHESRNAFQRSQACLEMLGLELEGNANCLELVGRIQRALDHLHHLYEEVRDYAAPIKLDRQVCDLAHLWRDSWSHLDVMRKEKALTLKEKAGHVDLRCQVDWFALGQVFRNILENAIAACPNPGVIEIRCENARLEGREAVRVSFHDNGPGLTEEVREKIFEPFFTTKSKGTGLGMAIARRIVEAHGGKISIGKRSQPGAEILVTLPRGPI